MQVFLEKNGDINGISQNEWIIRENSTKMDDLGVPRFQETPKWRDSRVKTGRFKHPEAKRSFRSCFWMMFHMNSSLLGDFSLTFTNVTGHGSVDPKILDVVKSWHRKNLKACDHCCFNILIGMFFQA